MALPEKHYRGDIVVMADWTATNGVGATWVNFCGATSVSLSIDNAVHEETVADCDDWTLPAQNIARNKRVQQEKRLTFINPPCKE